MHLSGVFTTKYTRSTPKASYYTQSTERGKLIELTTFIFLQGSIPHNHTVFSGEKGKKKVGAVI